jgi:hypothetical protein
MRTVNLAYHEFTANYLFTDAGLDPFFAFDSEIKKAEGSKATEFRLDGEKWRARLSYQSSNIVNPGGKTPQGTRFDIETIREYRVKIYRDPAQDPIGQQSFTAHIAPRWEGMEGEKSDGSSVKIPVPEGIGEGVNVRVSGSNIDFSRYQDLFRLAATCLGINGDYFRDYHEYSNIQDAERYVRLDRDQSGPVHSRDGPIASMGHLLESDRQGYRKIVQDETDVHGENLPGYYHTVTLGGRRIREAFPDHKLPKEVKHYYAKEANNLDDDHPLAHPKLGSSYQTSQHDETLHIDDLERLNRELEQTVLSVLADAGLDVAPSAQAQAYFEGPYFEIDVDHSGPDPIGLDLTRVRQSQESVVVRHVADGLNPTQWEALETLVTDGGEVSPADIADEHDRHTGSVRRALRDMEDLVHREYAEVSLASDYIAEMVHDAVSEARDATRRATETVGKALDAADRGLDETMSSFIAWAARHGIDVEGSRDARMTLRFGPDVEKPDKAIREGFRVWKDAGMPEERYREALVHFPGGAIGDAWRSL